MNKRIIYTPFISSKDLPEASAFSPHQLSPDNAIASGITFPQNSDTVVLNKPKFNENKVQLSGIRNAFSGNSIYNAAAWQDVWKQYGSLLGLKDEIAQIHLLGQIKHESGNFRYMEEIASGKAYEGRTDLGNTESGDGVKYKGRGPIQVTGKNNYKAIYDNFFVPNGLAEYNIVKNPELGNDPKIGSLMTIGWFLTTENGRKALTAINNHDIKSATKNINGGYNGLANREKIINNLLKESNLI